MPAIQVACHLFVGGVLFPSSHGSTSIVSSRLSCLAYQQVSLVSKLIAKSVTSLWNKMVVSVGPPSCHKIGRCRSRRSLARCVSSRAPKRFSRLQVGSVNSCSLTMRAADGGESLRQNGFFFASGFFRFAGFFSPAAATDYCTCQVLMKLL